MLGSCGKCDAIYDTKILSSHSLRERNRGIKLRSAMSEEEEDSTNEAKDKMAETKDQTLPYLYLSIIN